MLGRPRPIPPEAIAAASAGQPARALVTQTDLRQFSAVFEPSGLFSPAYPIPPMEPERVRTWDFRPGYNLIYTPRADEAVSFEQLRALSENHDITRLAIETRKDQIEELAWSFKARDEKNASPDAAKRIAALETFWASPDGRRPFATWLRELLEDLLVLDAPCLEVRRNRAGQVIGLDVIAGDTIKILIDDTGRVPLPPAPAYEQVIRGRPWALLTTDDLLYLPRNPRPHKPYGFGPVEQIIMTVNMALRRQVMQLQHFTEGNVPPGLMTVPETWTADDIVAFNKNWDATLAGNTGSRQRMQFGPRGAKYEPFKDAPIKDEFDEWLARVVCFAFSISPTALVKQYQRTTADTQQEASLHEGREPLLGWVKRLADHVVQQRMGHADLEFTWQADKPIDPKQQADIDDLYLRNGTKRVNEVRGAQGLDPIEGGDTALVYFAKDAVPLERLVNPPEPVEAAIPPKDAAGPIDDEEGEADPGVAKRAPKTLYVSRRLKNADDLRKWALDQGFAATLPAKDMHVTIAFSREPVDWDAIPDAPEELVVNDKNRGSDQSEMRSVELLGDEGAVVLKFASGALQMRWHELRDAGASWDHDGYHPHVTIAYDGAPADLSTVEPYMGPLVFGPERFKEVDPEWRTRVVEEAVTA